LPPIHLGNPLPFAIAAVPNAETGLGNPGRRHGCSLFEHMDTIEINYLHIATLFLVESGHVLWRRYHTGRSLLYRARCYRNFDEMLNLMCWLWRNPFCRRVGNIQQRNKAMIPSSRRDRKTKAMAEMLAMMIEPHPPGTIHSSCSVCETDEWMWEIVTDFCAALDRYAGRAKHIKRASH